MTKKSLYISWGALYVICAGLGAIPDPQGVLAGVMVILSLLFFVPPAMLLYRAIPREQWGTVRLVRNASLISLSLTLVLLLLNFLSIGTVQAVGDVLFVLLILVSSPMVCSQVWVLSLFLWACLLMVCLKHLRKKK